MLCRFNLVDRITLKGKKRREAVEQEKLLAKISKFSSYFGVRATSSQSSALDTVASGSASENQAKQDEGIEARQHKLGKVQQKENRQTKTLPLKH